MNAINIKPYNVITNTVLPELTIEQIPSDGDPVEIDGELYFVCELMNEGDSVIGVIPLIVKNPAKIPNINKYIECLSIAHRRVQFKNKKGPCGLETCDEMIIS